MTTDTWSTPDYAAVARVVAEHAGLAWPNHGARNAEAGIRRAMARAGASDPVRYRLLLTRDATVLDDLLVELTIGETYFFRNVDQFDVLREEVLPEIQARRGRDHVVRAWSAGCASGEEGYSLAIMFAEAGLAPSARVHATDISRAALAKARAATYSAWSLRGEGAASAQCYLRSVGGAHTVVDEIRKAVVFDHVNLALDVYPSLATGIWAMDVVLCRNVLIYFDRETVRRVARRLYASLAEGGWLVTAPSDPLLSEYAPFVTVITPAGIFYRRITSGPCAVPVVRPLSAALIAEAREAVEVVAAAPTAPTTAEDLATPYLTEAAGALERGEYARVVALTRDRADDAGASILLVRALANVDVADAERACRGAARRHASSADLQAVWALLLLELGRDGDAAAAARRALYLDGELTVAHFALATILCRQGNTAGGSRCYRRARDLCAARPPDELVPLGDGERCGRLTEAVDAQLALLASEQRSG